MKKRLLAILALLVALTLVVLTGCEKKVERKGGDDKTTKAETTEEAKNEGDDDTTEEGEGVVVGSPEEGKDKPSKPSKPESGNSAITNSDDFFDNTKDNDSVSQDYIEDAIENIDEPEESLEEVVKSGEFVVAMREVAQDGTVSVMKLARKGDNIAMFADAPEEKMGVIITADILYMVFADEKAYFALPTELLGQDIEELTASFDEIFDMDSTSDSEEPVKTYTETIDGVEYRVEEDADGRKSYYIGDRPVMGELEDGGMMYIDSFSGEVPDSVFEVPSGYRQMTMDEFQQMAQ